jgi:hypothetical protein
MNWEAFTVCVRLAVDALRALSTFKTIVVIGLFAEQKSVQNIIFNLSVSTNQPHGTPQSDTLGVQ